MKKHHIDVYNQEVLFFNTYKDFKKYLKKHGSSLDSDDDFLQSTGGCAGILDNNKEERSYFFIAIDSEQAQSVDELIEILVHESLHVTMMLLGLVGVEISPENHESATYLQQSIFRSYMKAFKVCDVLRKEGEESMLKHVGDELLAIEEEENDSNEEC